jgi:hypothetical protein
MPEFIQNISQNIIVFYPKNSLLQFITPSIAGMFTFMLCWIAAEILPGQEKN